MITFTHAGRLLIALAGTALLAGYLTGEIAGWEPWPLAMFNWLIGVSIGLGLVAYLEGATAVRAGVIALMFGGFSWVASVALLIATGGRP